MAAFLCAPLKKTNEVDLSKPLRTFISSTFKTSDDGSTESDEAVSEFNKLRNKAVMQPLDKHESSLDLLVRYYDQLVAIENKLPLTPTQIPIAFKWKDAFDKGSLFFGKASSLTLSYGTFERAAVLFNVGALMSQIAAVQPLGTDEELKSAAKLFQQSAGVFSHLKDTVLSLVQQEPTHDLMPDTLNALAAIMLAQGQEAIYLKASKDKMKPALLVKIAAQCGDFYQEAVKQMSREMLKGLWEKEWIPMANGKMLAFQGLAQYHQSRQNNENKEIGEELSRLAEALRLCQQAQTYFTTAGAPNAFKAEMTIIQKAHELAKKDNDFIYHERIPDLRGLPALGRAALAKTLPVTTPLGPRFKDLFETLVPVPVHQALAAYDVRRAEVVNMETGRLREHTQLMNGILASLNLPAALDDACNHETLPESIREKSAKVKAAGGIDSLTQSVTELPSLLTRNKEILEETSRLLTEEKQSDVQLRAQFKEKWTRMASERLTEPLWQEIGKYRGILDTAANADNIVRTKLDANRRGLELLSKPEPELKAAIPGLSSNTAGQNTPSVAQLKDLMTRVQTITAKRQTLEKEFKDASFDMSSTFLRALGESGALNEEQISTEKLNEIYGPLREQVSASVKEQETVMAQVQQANQQFCAEKSNTSSAERETMLKMLAGAHDIFMELRGNLQEGTKFYNDLTPLLVRLQQKVSDFVFARKTEKEDLMKDMQQTIVSQPTQAAPSNPAYHGGGEAARTTASAQPPPRPPPPNFAQAPSQSHPTAPPGQHPPMGAQAPMTAPMAYNPAAPPHHPYQPYPQQYGAAPPYPYPTQQQPYQTATPYPVAYPGTYPGAGHNPAAPYYPPPPQGYPAYPAYPPYPQQPYQQPPPPQ
uniref:BRO1 domain-containing protein n=1 Tax=Plectus sambesii TaxID=2011161 RepID=A0A914X123_9BILA